MAVTLTSGQERFSRIVAQRTGLELPTVRAWVVAESGGRTDRDGNPLSIMTNGRLLDFRTPEAAAARTVTLLRERDYYAPILTAGRSGTIREQLDAIIASPWEAGGYAGDSGARGTLLYGAYSRTYPRTAAAVTAGTDATPGAAPTSLLFPPVLPPIDVFPKLVPKVGGWVGDIIGWVGETAAIAFLYVALSVVGLLLMVLGTTRALGVGPRQALTAARGPTAAGGPSDEIPF